MLARVSSALVKYIIPVDTSGSSATSVNQETPQQQQQNKKNKDPPPPSQAEIKASAPLPPKSEGPPILTQVESALADVSKALSFVQIFSKIQDQRQIILQWLGRKTYALGARNRKGQAKKGTIFDEQAG